MEVACNEFNDAGIRAVLERLFLDRYFKYMFRHDADAFLSRIRVYSRSYLMHTVRIAGHDKTTK